MKQGTTTTFKVKQFDLPDITEIIFSFTNDKNNVVVEREEPTDDGQIHKSYPTDVSLEDGYYKIGLDQDETLQLNETFYVEAQIMFSGAVTKAYIDKVKMPHTFYTKVIDGATTNGEEIELAMELSDVIEIEGGGTGNYTDLTNKPKINNVELIGNKTTSDLGLDITTGDGLKREGNVVSVDLDDNSILEFDNHKLSADTSGLQPTISGGNGIDVSSNVVSVDIKSSNSFLDFASGKLGVDFETLGLYEPFRNSLTNTNYESPLVSKSYLDSDFYTKTEIDTALGNKQNTLTDVNGILIGTDNTIGIYRNSPQGITNYISYYQGGVYIDTYGLSHDELFRESLTSDAYQFPLQPKLTAGTNITIDSNNVISASGGGLSYTFTNGLSESSGTVGIDLASGSKLLIDANDKLDVDLSSKQDTIDSTHKLSADLVTDTSTTNKFVPTHSSSESGKVLGVDNQGALQWVAQSGGGSYSGGDGIDITNDTISVDLKSGSKLQFDNGELDVDLSSKEDKTTISTDTTSTTVSLTLADNNEYRYTQELTSLTLTMPSGDFISSIVFASGSTPTSMTYDSNIKWSGDDVTNGQFVPSADKDYDIMMYYNGLNVNGIVRGAE